MYYEIIKPFLDLHHMLMLNVCPSISLYHLQPSKFSFSTLQFGVCKTSDHSNIFRLIRAVNGEHTDARFNDYESDKY